LQEEINTASGGPKIHLGGWRFCGTAAGLAVLAVTAIAGAAAPPPNIPTAVEWNAEQGRLSLRYHGSAILEATVVAEDASGSAVPGAEVKLERTETPGEKVDQRLKFTVAKPRERATLVLRGTVTGSNEAFSAETASEAQKRFPLVRNSVGLSHNLRNNAVYDRRLDWVLIGPADGATRIQPQQVEKKANGPSTTPCSGPTRPTDAGSATSPRSRATANTTPATLSAAAGIIAGRWLNCRRRCTTARQTVESR